MERVTNTKERIILTVIQANISAEGEKGKEDIYVICRPGGPYWEKPCQKVLSTQDRGHSFSQYGPT